MGRPGRNAVSDYLSAHSEEYQIIIVNGENAAGGFGITDSIAVDLRRQGVDIITSGNHIWKQDSILSLLSEKNPFVIRPANYPPENPGKGWAVIEKGRLRIQVINLQGRVFTDFSGDCPFRTAERIIDSTEADVRIIDIHAEATSEKIALARYLDGKVTLIAGTHTHVQTADEQVFPGGTAYISDLGMCGSSAGVIGMEMNSSIARFTSGKYSRLTVAEGDRMVNGLELELNDDLSVKSLKRVNEYTG